MEDYDENSPFFNFSHNFYSTDNLGINEEEEENVGFSDLISEEANNNKTDKSHHIKFEINNPLITHFNQNSHFIYDINTVNLYLSKVNNPNLLKLNESEIEAIKNKIKSIEKEKELYQKDKIVFIEKSLAKDLDLFLKDKINSEDNIRQFLEKMLNGGIDRITLSVRKLAEKYQKETGIKISKSTIHNYLTKKMGYKYLKTTIKTDKTLQSNNIMISLSFVKIISRCLKFNFNIIVCDESYIQSCNNNIKLWRKPPEEICHSLSKKEKINLILSVYEEGVLYYELNQPNTKEENFLIYMSNLLKTIKQKGLNKYVIILDNYSVHKTQKLLKFYLDQKINILFNSPYVSKFNSVELSFRNLKRNIYTKCFESKESIKKEVELILESKNFANGIKGNFKGTLQQYLIFSEKEKARNLKNLKNEKK